MHVIHTGTDDLGRPYEVVYLTPKDTFFSIGRGRWVDSEEHGRRLVEKEDHIQRASVFNDHGDYVCGRPAIQWIPAREPLRNKYGEVAP